MKQTAKYIIAYLLCIVMVVSSCKFMNAHANNYTSSQLSGISNTLISNESASKYVNAAMQYYLRENSRVKSNLDNNCAVVFFFDGCSDNAFSSSFDYTSNHMSAYVAVVKLRNGIPTIIYENENSSTIPDNPRMVNDTSAGNEGTPVPTVVDGIHNILTTNHGKKNPYAALHVADGDYSNVNVIRCTSGNYWSATSTGINIHARSWDYVSTSTYSSTGCFNVGVSSPSTEYNDFMYAVTGISDARSNTFSSTGADQGIVIVDRYMYKSTLERIYDSSDLVEEITEYSTNLAPTILNNYTPNYANLGDDFYGVILNKACWKPISQVEDSQHIYLETENNSARQRWHFVRQDDGAYVISSCYDGKALEMYCGDHVICQHVSACTEFWGGAYQQWYLIPFNGGYIFQNKHFTSEDWVMDLYAGDTSDGNVIQINHRNYNDAQTWSVYTGDDVQLKAPTLTVQPGTDSTKTVFTWDSVYGSTRYDVKIWKDHVDHSVSSYHTEWGASSGYSIQLPPGTYEAYVTASDYYQCLGSQDVRFTVQGNTPADTPVDLGEDFYAVILSNEIWKPIGNDHATDNFVRLQTGEHENSSAHQLWRFQRQSDGSYAIRSTQDGHCLEFYRGEREENNPVSAGYDWWNGAYQKWWIYQNSNGGYFFESDHFTSDGWYMTLKDNNSADGTPITMCRFTGQNNQVWGIYGTSDVQLKAPTLTVNTNTASEATEFSWDHVFGAKEFQVKIWENQYDETKSPDYTETVTTTSSNIQLPAGDYEASVTASNYWQSYTSQIIHFTVDEETYQVIVGDADGDGDICLKDVVQLTRFLSGGWNVTVDMIASDVNKDGYVDLKDVVILQRYLAGGWGVQLA